MMALFAVSAMAKVIKFNDAEMEVAEFMGRSTPGVIGIIPVFNDFRSAFTFAGGDEDRILRVED